MASHNRVGEVLASKYRLLELLGSGGMGDVYRAVNESIGRTVAIKLLRPEHAENTQLVERFLREARAANLVRHPNVVDVLDIGKDDGGAPFIVQELLVGEDLAHLARRRGGKLPVEEVCDLLLPVIDAVAEAHARGVVHRDVKPENIFLADSPKGPVPKLLDFGISKVRAPDLRATEVGMMMGTPAYMPPEQVQGARDADTRSDVWALGVVMFELLAGRFPFDQQDAPALFVAIATQDAPTLLAVNAAVTPAVSRVVERCLRRNPDERYPSAAELGRDLRHVRDGSELEPTGRHSIPPSFAQLIPDLAIPVASRPPPLDDDVDARARTEVGIAPEPGRGRGRDGPLPKTPSLPPPRPSAPRAVPSSAKLRAAPPPEPVAQPGPRAAPASATVQFATRAGQSESDTESGLPGDSMEPLAAPLAAPAALSGVGLAPSPASVARAPTSRRPGPAARTRSSETDFSPLIGLGVVSLAATVGTALLMQLAHRPDGWAVAHFLFAPGQGGALAFHAAFALLAAGFGLTLCRRGVHRWRGDIDGSRPGALLNAAMASGAFFCAIELLAAVL